MNYEFFNGKTVLIMGLGRFGGGVDSAQFAHNAGAKVIITDLAKSEKLAESINKLEGLENIEYHLGSHNQTDFEKADIVIVNPAVHPENELLEIARRNNALITSQINIFFELCSAMTIGITGANGKSTTAALTAHLLRAAIGRGNFKYSNVLLSGNIGNEPLLTKISQLNENDLVVLELSSFQLEQLSHIRKAPRIALITNLSPNHLDRHGTFADYCSAKKNIFELQKLDETSSAVSIFNAEDTIANQWFQQYKNQPGRIALTFSAQELPAEFHNSFTLPGRANLENLAAAITIAGHLGVDNETIKNALPQFKSLPHRLELVATINDISWYNDSIATTPQSTIVAIEAFDRPKILIAGGYDKNLPFAELGEKIAEKVKAAILFGQTAENIAEAIAAIPKTKTRVEIVDSLADAVNLADKLAEDGDVVLLSPACASYDMFDNFQQRGQIFRDLVNTLKKLPT